MPFEHFDGGHPAALRVPKHFNFHLSPKPYFGWCEISSSNSRRRRKGQSATRFRRNPASGPDFGGYKMGGYMGSVQIFLISVQYGSI